MMKKQSPLTYTTYKENDIFLVCSGLNLLLSSMKSFNRDKNVDPILTVD